MTAATTTTNPIDQFFAKVSQDFQIFEEDVILVIQNIGAGIEVAAEDIQQSLGWLGTHIGQISASVTAVQSTLTSLNAAGVAIPTSLTNGIAEMNSAVNGVNEALNNQAITANGGQALTVGYQATKTLQIAAAGAAAIAASIQAATAPAPTPATSN